jgi:hypothetical protein
MGLAKAELLFFSQHWLRSMLLRNRGCNEITMECVVVYQDAIKSSCTVHGSWTLRKWDFELFLFL